MPADIRVTARLETDLIEEAKRASGMTSAPLARLIRAGLLALAGRQDPVTSSAVPMGRPPKNTRT